MDPALKTEESKVRGCTSQVWIVDRVEPGVAPGSPATLHFIADSDAHIVKGLIAVLLSLYDGRTPEEILAIDIKDAIARLGFAQALSQPRQRPVLHGRAHPRAGGKGGDRIPLSPCGRVRGRRLPLPGGESKYSSWPIR